MRLNADHVLQVFTEPGIAIRVGLVLVGAAGAGVLVLMARGIFPAATRFRGLKLAVAQSGFAYLLLGLASRFVIQHHRSRLQMLLLLGVVAAVEALRYRRGDVPVRVATWIAGSACVCLGVVAAKWALEPGALTEALVRLRQRQGLFQAPLRVSAAASGVLSFRVRPDLPE